MAYKTVSRNFQRWSVCNDNYTKEHTRQRPYEFRVDFSLSLYFIQDFIDGLFVVCKHCKHTNNISLEYIKNIFQLDTNFRIIYRKFRNNYPCNKCKCQSNIVYIIKKKMSKEAADSILCRQSHDVIKKEQEKNRKELFMQTCDSSQIIIRKKHKK